MNKLLPAIHSKWKGNREEPIYIQVDGAQGHKPKHLDILIPDVALSKYNLDVEMKRQPPQSPQFNVLDCGIFNAVEKSVLKAAPTSIDELISVVKKSWSDLPRETIDNVFLSAMCSMRD